MAQYVRCVEGIPCVLDEHNVEYKILERCGNVEKSAWKRQLYSQQAGKMKRFESRAILHYSACTAVSQNDMDILKRAHGREHSCSCPA